MTLNNLPWPTRLLLVVITAAFLALAPASPAFAQDDSDSEQGRFGRAQEQCMDVTDSRAVLDQLVEDGAITQEEKDAAAGLFGFNNDKVQAIQQENAERWDEIAQHHAETRGFFGNALRAGQAGVCWVASPVNAAVDAVSNSPFWDDPIGKFAQSVLEGNNEALVTAMRFWVDFDTSSVNVSANTQGVKNIVMGLAGLALVASFIIGGWRIVAARRGGLAEGVSELNENALRWLIFSIAVPAAFPGAMIASDKLAEAIMTEFGGAGELINFGGIEDTQFGPVLTLILALVMLAGSVVQILALVTRVLLAPIAAGLTPLFAALSFSDTGRQGLNHLVAFLIAAIAFKPVSALLYAVVLWNVTGQGDIGVVGGIINALMIGIAGFAGPALVRALVPAVAQAGGGGSAPMLAGATGIMAGAAGIAGSALGRGGAALGALGRAGGAGGQAASAAGGGMSAAGTGATTSAGSTASRAATKTQPSGSGGAGGPVGSRGRSAASQPSGAGGSRAKRFAQGAGRAAGGAARGTARATGGAMRGAGAAATAVGAGVRRAGETSYRGQQLFDDSIGVPGGYAGQAYR